MYNYLKYINFKFWWIKLNENINLISFLEIFILVGDFILACSYFVCAPCLHNQNKVFQMKTLILNILDTQEYVSERNTYIRIQFEIMIVECPCTCSRVWDRKSTQWTNFQSLAYFAYIVMKLTLIYIKVVKYFPFWHNFILNGPASSARKLLPGKVPARINISRNDKYPQIHFLQ